MKSLILTVEDVFDLKTAGGLVLAPFIDQNLAEPLSGKSVDAELVKPDGSRLKTQVSVSWFHFNPQGYELVCTSRCLGKSDIPIGTEIWCEVGRLHPDNIEKS